MDDLDFGDLAEELVDGALEMSNGKFIVVVVIAVCLVLFMLYLIAPTPCADFHCDTGTPVQQDNQCVCVSPAKKS